MGIPRHAPVVIHVHDVVEQSYEIIHLYIQNNNQLLKSFIESENSLHWNFIFTSIKLFTLCWDSILHKYVSMTMPMK